GRFATEARGQGAVGVVVDIFVDEAHRPIAQDEVGPARVPAAEGDGFRGAAGREDTRIKVLVPPVERVGGGGEALMSPVLPDAPVGDDLTDEERVRRAVRDLANSRAVAVARDHAARLAGVRRAVAVVVPLAVRRAPAGAGA